MACTNHEESWHRRADNKDPADIDIAIAVEHLCLAATEQGLGTCWVCNFDASQCSTVLGLPEYIEPAVLIPVGYAESMILSTHISMYPTQQRNMFQSSQTSLKTVQIGRFFCAE